MRPKSIATVVVAFGAGERDVVDLVAGLGDERLGLERLDLGDRVDEGRLADAEAAGHDDLDGMISTVGRALCLLL